MINIVSLYWERKQQKLLFRYNIFSYNIENGL